MRVYGLPGGLIRAGSGPCGRTDPTTQAVNPEARPGQLAAIGRVTRGEPHPNQHLPVLRSRIRSFCATSLDAARDRRQKELTVGRERAITARLSFRGWGCACAEAEANELSALLAHSRLPLAWSEQRRVLGFA
jgi:hypothetical protein